MASVREAGYRVRMDATGPQSATHPNAMSSQRGMPAMSIHVVYPSELAGAAIEMRHELVIGRNPAQEVAHLAQRTVSSRHAQITTSNGYWLKDLDSTNGTRLNGGLVRHHAYLLPQAVVRFGDVIGVIDEPADCKFGRSSVLPGTHPAHTRILEQLSRAALDPAPVLIFGETGTGKERLALEVHRLSGRRGAYVPVNCAELSVQLMESQLFGHERGAFTGAESTRSGLFEAAQGGTLFLDEIGELPLELQPKLLRVLQENEIRPVGSVRTRRVDVRIVAATNQDLPLMVEQGRFRRDLYARLSLWDFRLPALREVKRDLLSWIQYLSLVWARERNVEIKLEFLPDAAEMILLSDWLDNLRGLNRLVHRLASGAADRPIGIRTLNDAMPELFETKRLEASINGVIEPYPVQDGLSLPAPAVTIPSATARPAREEFLEFYENSGRNIRATSKHFGKDRRQIYRWLELFGIDRMASKDD